MPGLTRALQGIRHPVFLMDVACTSEDTGACALQGTRALEGICRSDGILRFLQEAFLCESK
jgi:hypothetical protein